MRLDHIAPSLNVIDKRDELFLIIPYTDYQQALFYAGMTGAVSVAALALLIWGFVILVHECARFNSMVRA